MSVLESDLACQVARRALGPISLTRDKEVFRIDDHPEPIAVYPKDIDEVGALLKEANIDALPVVPIGGGTRLPLGNLGTPPAIALHTSNLNQAVAINAADLTATFEAGIRLSEAQEILGGGNQFLAMDAPLPERATLGGILASGATGPLKWQYGNPRDLVIGMKVVQADGSITKSGGQVVKNVSGYDMSRLHIGAIGTLGVIVEISFKLTPEPMEQRTVLVAFEDTKSCGDAAQSIFNSQIMPLALTSFDKHTLQATGLPAISGSQFLAVKLGGRPRSLTRLVDETLKISQAQGISNQEVLREDDNLTLWRHLADFGWIGDSTPEVIIRTSFVPNRVREFVDAISEPHSQMNSSYVSNPGYGNVLVAWRFELGTDPIAAARSAIEITRRSAYELNGSAIIESCPVPLKREFDIWGDARGAIDVMRRMKNQYDPKGILNPGRFIGGI